MSLRSMTGFGRASYAHNGYAFEILIKGVNSRFAEYNFKLPQSLSHVEQDIRAVLQKQIQRGKVTLVLNGNFEFLTRTKLYCDKNAVQNYVAICRSLGLPTSGQHAVTAKWEALRIPGVLKVSGEEISPQGKKLLTDLLRRGLDSFLKFKIREGSRIQRELRTYNRRLHVLAGKMSASSQHLKQEGEKHIRELADRYCRDADSLRDRIGFEIASALDRLDVSEECARLGFHIDEFQTALSARSAAVGRKLDFLLQEMHREINTIGSKGRDSTLSRWVVEAKDCVECMREQVQNVE